MALVASVAVAGPLWQPLSYVVPPALEPLARVMARVVVPLGRSGARVGFIVALEEGPSEGLKPLHDILDDTGQPTVFPLGMLGFLEEAAGSCHMPLGQFMARVLPPGLGSPNPSRVVAEAVESERVLELAGKGRAPRSGTQLARVLELLLERRRLGWEELKQVCAQPGRVARRLVELGWARVGCREVVRDLVGEPVVPEPEPQVLTPGQQEAVGEIEALMGRGGVVVVWGVTGSGKSEVYARACRLALEQGLGAVVLTPEIGLCVRMEGLLRERLGPGVVGVLHSGLGPAARRGQWMAIAGGKLKVVVGARSAVFAPLEPLGLIVVDEEQDEAYKSSQAPRYHARELALARARHTGAVVVLGSATPSVATYHHARKGRYTLVRMPSRVGGARMPKVEVVDLRGERLLVGGFMSRRLWEGLKAELARGRQVMIFLNRRGLAPAVICTACGKPLTCPGCATSLVLHARPQRRLVCHICGHTRGVPGQCPACGSRGLKPIGLGTQAVASRLERMLPGVRVGRLDRDTVMSPSALKRFLRAMYEGEIELVVGTQMLTKGHHFPRLGLVGVVLADQGLAVGDYRAAERCYIQLTQVAGRAGRVGEQGLVIIQAYDPAHPAVVAAARAEPELFYDSELAQREALGYPPFRELVAVWIEGGSVERVEGWAQRVALAFDTVGDDVEVLGPAPAPLARVKSRWRWVVLVKAGDRELAGAVVREGLARIGRAPGGVSVVVDPDPVALW